MNRNTPEDLVRELLQSNRNLTQDADDDSIRWITIHPFGMTQEEADTGEGKRYYQRIPVDKESGTIVGGLGNKLNGTNIKDLSENLKNVKEDKPLKMSDGEGGNIEKKEAEKPKSRFPNYKAPEKKSEEAEKPVTIKKYNAKEIFAEIESERLKDEEMKYGGSKKADRSILDKQYYKDIKDRTAKVLERLKGDEYEDKAVENLKGSIGAIVGQYSDTYTRSINLARRPDFSYDPEWTNFEKQYRDEALKQLDELERYADNPEKYKADSEQIRNDLKSLNDELEFRRKALAKLPNDRGTNSYLSKLLNNEAGIENTLKNESTPFSNKLDRWNPVYAHLSGMEEMKTNAEKLIKSIDKNPKYTDVLAKAKEGEYYKNISDVTEEQKERAEAKEERKQEKIDRLRERAEQHIDRGYERFAKGRKVFREDEGGIPFGQPNIEGRLTGIINKAENDMRKGSAEVDYGRSLQDRADKMEANTNIRSDDPLAIQKLQAEVENSVGTRRAYYQKKLDSALKAQERANTGGLKKETKLYKLDEDFADGRIRFRFDGKPRQEVIDIMKSRGFKWSPSNKAWQRQNTPNGVYSAKKVIEELAQYEND